MSYMVGIFNYGGVKMRIGIIYDSRTEQLIAERKRKRFVRSAKRIADRLLLIIGILSAVSALMASCFLDSENYMPFLITLVAGLCISGLSYGIRKFLL